MAPPTNPYGGSGQYQQQAPPSMFPAAATMATSGYQQGSTSKQVTIPDSVSDHTHLLTIPLTTPLL